MQLVDRGNLVSWELLQPMAEKMFGNIVKAVVDLDKKIMLIDAEMHADEEAELLDSGSKQENLWGINLHPFEKKVEFDSMINIRPKQNNRSRSVEDPTTQAAIQELVKELVH